MFGGSFNRLPFNRDLSVTIYAIAAFHGSGMTNAKLTVDIPVSASIHGSATAEAMYLREQFVSAVIHGSGTAASAIGRDLLGMAAAFHGAATVNAEVRRHYVNYVRVTGPFAPGDKIVIDSAKMRVTRNSLPVAYDGNIFDLAPGMNDIIYTDTATGRTVQVRITWRDRFL